MFSTLHTDRNIYCYCHRYPLPQEGVPPIAFRWACHAVRKFPVMAVSYPSKLQLLITDLSFKLSIGALNSKTESTFYPLLNVVHDMNVKSTLLGT